MSYRADRVCQQTAGEESVKSNRAQRVETVKGCSNNRGHRFESTKSCENSCGQSFETIKVRNKSDDLLQQRNIDL